MLKTLGPRRTFSEESLSTAWYICDSARPVTEGVAAAALAGSSVPKDLRDTRLQRGGARGGESGRAVRTRALERGCEAEATHRAEAWEAPWGRPL